MMSDDRRHIRPRAREAIQSVASPGDNIGELLRSPGAEYGAGKEKRLFGLA